jgi:hypothetical protein
MKNKTGKLLTLAVVFSAFLVLSSGAQASSLFGLDGDRAERQIGLFEQALQWLGGTWDDLTSVFAFSEETPPPPPAPQCTSNCADAGAGIDPEG